MFVDASITHLLCVFVLCCNYNIYGWKILCCLNFIILQGHVLYDLQMIIALLKLNPCSNFVIELDIAT